MAFDRARIPDALVDAYKEDRCGLLVGAGASVVAYAIAALRRCL